MPDSTIRQHLRLALDHCLFASALDDPLVTLARAGEHVEAALAILDAAPRPLTWTEEIQPAGQKVCAGYGRYMVIRDDLPVEANDA
jgi:hypothetical protein